jgi:uncharacterized membrane protein YfcA
MVIAIMITCVLIITFFCAGAMFCQMKKQPSPPLSPSMTAKLSLSGVIAFIADTLGIGSFAVNITLAKVFGTFEDEELPAVCNAAQVVPGTIESLFFMQSIHVDLVTLTTLVLGTCVGGLLGGLLVTRLNRQAIRLLMLCAFTFIIILLLCDHWHILPIGGNAMALHANKLLIGFLGMIVCGALTSAGIGLFVMVQSLLFLLNVSPLVAFPIMTTAGAMQQPLTAWVFLRAGKIPLKKTLILSLGGCLGVGLTLLFFHELTTTALRSILLGILVYNLLAIGQDYYRASPRRARS